MKHIIHVGLLMRRNLTLYLLRCETHYTCRSVEEKNIPLCTPLSMVWLSMALMELGLNNEDLYDLSRSRLCELKYECLNNFWVWVMICLWVAFQDFLDMNWYVMIMLWLGEGCSPINMKRIFLSDALKSEWVKVLFACVHWVLKLLDDVINVMNCSYMYWSPCCD